MEDVMLSAMEKEGLTQKDYLYLLRKFSKIENLETIIAHKEATLNEDQFALLCAAADHRRAEIITNKLYDRVPREVWRLVR